MSENIEIKRLGDLCELVTKGTTPTSLGHKFVDEGINFIKVESLTASGEIIANKVAYIDENCHNVLKRSQLKEDDILFSIAGALGRIGIVKKEIIPANTNQALAIIRLKENSSVLVSYLARYFNSSLIQDEIEKLRGGAAQQNLSLSQLNDLKIPIPSICQQEQIIKVLDKAFTAIDKAKANAEENLKNAKELFESYLQGVFENKDGDWEEKTLGELADFRNGINYTKSSKGEKVKIVGVRDFQNSFWVPYKTLDSAILDGKINELDLLQKGDIITVRSNGNPQLIGRTLLADDVKEKVSHSGFTIRIRLNTKNINSVYLCHFLKIPSTRKILVDGGNGVGIKSLNQVSLSLLSIPYPKSLSIQESIVKNIEAFSKEIKHLKNTYLKKIDDLEELKKSILQKAFSGELKI
ncbi:restriction endonuclease subunit S [Flavobacterium sp. SM2513]|uniref:restriction endonuclease subunit S n=1 Tax=Flavobacterium sp. SM2513 TaxID=3424766 RepID=UPI003D7FC04A